MATDTMTPDLRDLVFAQNLIPVTIDDSQNLCGENLLRAISSSQVHHASQNSPKNKRKFSLQLKNQFIRNPETSLGLQEGEDQLDSEAPMIVMTPDFSGICFVSRRIDLTNPVKVGRGNGSKSRPSVNNAFFDCKVLSRTHAIVSYENQRFFIRDCHSSNGTFVNKNRLTGNEGFEIFNGDVIQFGQDVHESGTNEKHRCIIAKIELFHPSGKLCNARPVPLKNDDHDVKQQLKEAMEDLFNQEESLHKKLIRSQELIQSIKESVWNGLENFVSEDELLTKIERLEEFISQQGKVDSLEELRNRSEFESTVKRLLKSSSEKKLSAELATQEAELLAQRMSEENRTLCQQVENLKKKLEVMKCREKTEVDFSQTDRGPSNDGLKFKEFEEPENLTDVRISKFSSSSVQTELAPKKVDASTQFNSMLVESRYSQTEVLPDENENFPNLANSLEVTTKRVTDKCLQMDNFLMELMCLQKKQEAKIVALEQTQVSMVKVEAQTHRSVFYLSAFIVLALFLFLLKCGVKESRRLEVW